MFERPFETLGKAFEHLQIALVNRPLAVNKSLKRYTVYLTLNSLFWHLVFHPRDFPEWTIWAVGSALKLLSELLRALYLLVF